MGFTHLHVHSEYSLLDSTCRLDQLVDTAAKLGMSSLAITDTGVLYGAIPFYKACVTRGLHPIIGMEVPLESGQDGKRKMPNQKKSSLVLLAENDEGYRNLVKISTLIQTQRHQLITKEALRPYTTGLIALSGGPKGDIEEKLIARDRQGAKQLAQFYKQLFPGRLYLEIQDHGKVLERELMIEVVRLAEECNLPLVATNDVHYLEKKDAFAHQCLTAVRTGETLEELKHTEQNDHYYLKSPVEMEGLFQSYPEALKNTEVIANRCHVTIDFGQFHLPKFPVPHGHEAKAYLKSLCEHGAKHRYGTLNDQVKERLEYELSIIDQMGFNDYFLIVWDVVRYARKNGIRPGPGRGSAAGAIVSYLLGITDVDPIQHELLFERFLNPERVSMPDIDIDFPDDRRDEIILYVHQKYGSDRVAQIGTFGTLAAKAALRDMGRVLGTPTALIDRIVKYIPSKPGITLQEAAKSSGSLQDFLKENKDAKALYRLAYLVEGLPRHTSIHAAGIIISADPLTNLVPLAEGRDGVHVTQYPMEVLEALGLLKMDFLSLRNLTLIEEILDLVENEKGIRPVIDDFPLDDALTYKLLSDGDTTGVFQFERDGLRNILKKLKPTEFSDIVAVNALNRPGPMQNIPTFIDARHGKVPIRYPHPDLEPILKSTYGIIVYQEQIIQVAAKMAGYSLGEADILRRAVSKKKRDVLEQEEKHFVEGCLKRGYTREVAKTLYDWIVRFADYGFNRAHAVAYTVIAYWLAYLKAHEPAAFMTALLSSVIHHTDKLIEYQYELSKKGIKVLPPSINQSEVMFKNTADGIRYGLSAIKNVGIHAVRDIINHRKQGPYLGLFDLCARVSGRTVNRRTLEALIFAGALDEFGVDRSVLLATLDGAMKATEKNQYRGEQTTLGIEGQTIEAYADVPPLTLQEKLHLEKEALGFYLSAHPLDTYTEKIKRLGGTAVQQCRVQTKNVMLAGMVDQFRQVRTKGGRQMGLMILNDQSGIISAVAFPNVFEKDMRLFQNGSLIWVEGSIEQRGEEKQVVIQKVMPLQDVQDVQVPQRLFLRISSKHGSQEKLNLLKQCLEKYHGETEVFLYYADVRKTVRLSNKHAIHPTDHCIKELQILLGKENVILQEHNSF